MSGKELLVDPKVAQAVAGMTMSSGMAVVLEWIPTDIGKLATLAGFCLSVVLIVIHIRRHLREGRKVELEMAILRKQLDGTLPPPPLG